MKFEVEPYGKQYRFDQESDIINVSFSQTGLRLTVIAATTMFTNIYIDIHFSSADGFRFLDEGDLIAYWESKAFNTNHHIYKILSGGWSNGQTLDSGILSISSSGGFGEWFIVTTNGCMNVISGDEPRITEFTNASISSYKVLNKLCQKN